MIQHPWGYMTEAPAALLWASVLVNASAATLTNAKGGINKLARADKCVTEKC